MFVQFADDPEYAPFGSWPKGQAPIYLDSIIATTKNMSTTIPWWEKYNPYTEIISSQWMEISRGKFHVISPLGAFSVVLGNASEYTSEQQMNQAIWMDLHRQGLIDWRPYDKWTLKQTDGYFYNRGDSIVDCIYKIHRSRGRGPMPNHDGFSSLSKYWGEWLVDTTNNIKAHYGNSGFTVSFRALKSQYIGASGHEHGHHTISGGHIQNGRVSYGIGFDGFFSPYEMILSEYMTPRTAVFGVNNTLGDYSSRNNNAEGEILKVIIDNSNGKDECFLLANRRKVSRWDRVMMGDTAQIEPYDDYTEYGKGLYIYHIKDGVHSPVRLNDTVQDLECADGYWEWELKSTSGIAKVPFDCYISEPDWRIYQKKTVLYTNDPSNLGEFDNEGSNYGNPNPLGDGVSFFYRYNNKPQVSQWSLGKESTSNCLLGTDRVFTNNEDYYFNYERAGDRYDAWNVGYNEIFSPYSSPSTVKWNNEPSGVFIWYHSLNGNTANIKVYKASEYGGNLSLDSILKLTPPSRPMNLQVEITDCIDSRRYPRLTWHHNLEPDMMQGIGRPQKRYKIYRAWSEMEDVPGNYEEIDDVLISASTDFAEYLDYETFALCDFGTPELNYRLRYMVKAVDIYEDISVYSDFASTSTYYLNRGGEGGDAIHSGEIYTYELKQNYPNPFNPVTNIQYQIVNQGMVTLKVYDLLGREVKTLVNEIKSPGKYLVSFDASSLSSGVYFYKISAGEFSDVKRMVLIK